VGQEYNKYQEYKKYKNREIAQSPCFTGFLKQEYNNLLSQLNYYTLDFLLNWDYSVQLNSHK
jgi:hypothetical protein